MSSWWGDGGTQAAEDTQSSQREGTGWWSYVKGLFGLDSLKEEDAGDAGQGQLVQDEQARKGLWSIMSSAIGRDITSGLSLPVWLFEPTSFLHLMAEPLEFNDYFVQAAKSDDWVTRLQCIAAWNIALWNRAVRIKKPFNPILGETLEYVPKDDSFKFIAEQVSHHPPISVAVATSELYELNLESRVRTKFLGNSVEAYVDGLSHLDLKTTGEHYAWNAIATCAHNIFIGSLWADHYGTIMIDNTTTGAYCVLEFKKGGWLGGGRYVVEGSICDKNARKFALLRGKWTEYLDVARVDNSSNSLEGLQWTRIWTVAGPEDLADQTYRFSKFLNYELLALTDEHKHVLPDTDSRKRSDRLALHEGNLEFAQQEKHRLEEKQRAERRSREARNEAWVPRHFKKVDDAIFKYRWVYVGDYWEQRKKRVATYEKMNGSSLGECDDVNQTKAVNEGEEVSKSLEKQDL